ncbi:MAG: helix-turn-helix transcriptional regulator [Bacteroidetes bacterium]|nr:helix-turn-helix transcriptional regulator [Bacteroidota bacterium]
MEKKIHQGRNITRFRQLLGLKQEALASALGDDWTQIKVSRLEAKEEIEKGLLEDVAKALKIPVDAIRNFDEEQAIYNISCSFSDNAMLNNRVEVQNINPIEKWLEAMEENKRLYEALLKEKDEKLALMEKLLDSKK